LDARPGDQLRPDLFRPPSPLELVQVVLVDRLDGVASHASNGGLVDPGSDPARDRREVQTLADARADHEERLQDLERWVGLPVGGRKAIEATVDQWIAESLNEPTHESEDT
jgi:hypothetical protein